MRKLDANMVVIGGGGTGVAAALTAIEQGITSIVLLEKRAALGGNATMAAGFLFAAGSRHQREAGAEISRDTAFKESMAYHHYKANPRILRTFINTSAETLQWLEDQGVVYEWDGVMNAHRPRDLDSPVGGFDPILKLLAEKFQARGGQILKNTAAKKILREPDGNVTEVIATAKDGEEIQIRTRSIILGPGGFTGNQELLKKYFPLNYDENVYWTDAKPLMGDGIALATSAGASLAEYCALIRENGYSFRTKKRMPNRASMEPCCIWVNAKGERIIGETVAHINASTNALLVQPGKVGFALYDDALIQRIVDRPEWGFEPNRRNLKEVLVEEAKQGEWSKIAERWEEIADWLGADQEVLKATVEEYNVSCGKGHDELFAKDRQYLLPLRKPPFYALKFRPLMIETVGPVKTNVHMEVLDKQGTPIPGLYAGGALTSGWQGDEEHRFGTPLSYALTSGRIAGARAASYLRGNLSVDGKH